MLWLHLFYFTIFIFAVNLHSGNGEGAKGGVDDKMEGQEAIAKFEAVPKTNLANKEEDLICGAKSVNRDRNGKYCEIVGPAIGLALDEAAIKSAENNDYLGCGSQPVKINNKKAADVEMFQCYFLENEKSTERYISYGYNKKEKANALFVYKPTTIDGQFAVEVEHYLGSVWIDENSRSGFLWGIFDRLPNSITERLQKIPFSKWIPFVNKS